MTYLYEIEILFHTKHFERTNRISHTQKNSCLVFTGHFVYKVITFPYNYNKQTLNINE